MMLICGGKKGRDGGRKKKSVIFPFGGEGEKTRRGAKSPGESVPKEKKREGKGIPWSVFCQGRARRGGGKEAREKRKADISLNTHKLIIRKREGEEKGGELPKKKKKKRERRKRRPCLRSSSK